MDQKTAKGKKPAKPKTARKSEAQDASLLSGASEPREGEVQTKAKPKSKTASATKTTSKTKSASETKSEPKTKKSEAEAKKPAKKSETKKKDTAEAKKSAAKSATKKTEAKSAKKAETKKTAKKAEAKPAEKTKDKEETKVKKDTKARAKKKSDTKKKSETEAKKPAKKAETKKNEAKSAKKAETKKTAKKAEAEPAEKTKDKEETKAKKDTKAKAKKKSETKKKDKAETKKKDKAEAKKEKAEAKKPKSKAKSKAKAEKEKEPVPAKEEPPVVPEVEPEVIPEAEEELVGYYWSPRQRAATSRHAKRHRTKSRQQRLQAAGLAPAEKVAPAKKPAAAAAKPEEAQPAGPVRGWIARHIPLVAVIAVVVALVFGGIFSLSGEKEPLAATFDKTMGEKTTGIEWTEMVLDRLPKAKSGPASMGNYTPSKEIRQELKDEIAAVRASGHHISFVMLDMETGQGLAYDTGREFYGASSIKIHRIMGIVAKHPDVVKKYRGTIRAVLTYSDNDAYATLYRAYGNGVLNSWVKKAGAKVRYNPSMQYVYYDAASLARLWFLDYKAMNKGKEFEQVGKWAEHPELSPIHQVLGKDHTTRTKAGWIGQAGYHAAVDGGIVYGKNSTYLLVVMSDYGADLNKLKPVIRTLNKAHTEAWRQLKEPEEEQ